MRHLFTATASAVLLCIAPAAFAQDHGDNHGSDHGESKGHSTEPTDTTKPSRAPTRRPIDLRGLKPALPATSPTSAMPMDHSGHGAQPVAEGPPPPRAFDGPKHAADAIYGSDAMAIARAYNHAAHGNMRTGVLLVERLEARIVSGEDGYVWDATGWYGSATDKFVLKTEGEGAFGGSVDDAEVQALWGHAIGPFADLQAGIRVDVEPETRPHLAIGVAGLAPYMIHFDAAAFVSDQGDLTARIEGEHDMKLTQRLILQPRVEAELAAQDIPDRGVGVGLSKIEFGARLRYEIIREFAPYVGLEFEGATGRTADYIRAEGGNPSGLKWIAGVRFWF